MLLLKGNVGKSVVLQSLIESYPDSYAIIYDKEPIRTVNACYISSKDFNLEDLCESIKREIESECKSRSMIIVYTNLSESEINCVKSLVEKFESVHFCRWGIVMCKE